METKDVLINRANTIINETKYFANDGPRVGGLIKDVVEYADGISQGQISLGTVANLTELSTPNASTGERVNPVKGDRWIVSDQINPENNLPYYFVYRGNSDGQTGNVAENWANSGETIMNADAVTKNDLKTDLIKVNQQLTYQPSFPLEDADRIFDPAYEYISCIDYYTSTILGIRLKVRDGGILNLYKVNIRAESYEFIKSITQPLGEATIQDILFDEAIKLEPFERLGVQGYTYHKEDISTVLKPMMHRVDLSSGYFDKQYHTVVAYALITPNDISHIETISPKTESLEFESVKGKVIADEYIRLSGVEGDSSHTSITTASLLQLPESGEITSITANVYPDTDIQIMLGELADNKLYEVDRITARSDHKGLLTVNTSLFGLKGQYLGLYKDSSKFVISLNGISGSRFLQFPVPNSTYAGVNLDGWIGMSYTLKSKPAIDLDINIEGYAKGLFYQGLIAPRSGYRPMNANKWATFNSSALSFNGKVTKLWIDVETAGQIEIGVGVNDQRNWAVIDKIYTIDAYKSGLNEFAIDQIQLTENQRLFFRTSLSVGYNEKGYHLETLENSVQLQVESDDLIFKYEIDGKRIITSPLASKTELSEVQVQVSDISATVNSLMMNSLYKQSPDGSYWMQTIDNNGQTTWQKVESEEVTVFGNSFDIHPIIPGTWWGYYGMAATRRENDWVHRSMSRLMNLGILSTITAFPIPDWETDASIYDYSRLDPYLKSNTKLVIIRIGENVPEGTDLTEDTKTLINYIRSKVPNVPIIFGGLFFTNHEKQAKLKAAVDSFGDIPFIDFQDLDLPEYKSAIGTLVLGDDGEWHAITNSAVANHAGDKGQDAMSERIVPYAYNVLK